MIKPCECETFILDYQAPDQKSNMIVISKHVATGIFSDRFYCNYSNLKVTRKKVFKNLQQKVKENLKK
jgi:hypothetical protein